MLRRLLLSTTPVAVGTLLLSACGGGGGGSPTPPQPPANIAPVAALSIAETTVREGDVFSLDASGSTDGNGDTLRYSYRVASGPTTDLSGANAATGSVTAPSVDADSTLTVEVTVTDGRGGSDTATASVDVIDNAAPETALVANDESGMRTEAVLEGSAIVLDASGTFDAENDPITFTYLQIAGPDATIPAGTGASVSFSVPEVDADTVLTFEVQADDGRDVSVARVDVMVENIMLEPDAGFDAELTATLRTERELVGLFNGVNSDGLVLSRAADGTIDAATTTLNTDATAFLPLVDVQEDVAAGLGAVSDVVDVFTTSNTVALIGEEGIRFAEFDIQRQGDTLSAGAWTDLGTLSVDGACAIAVDNNVRSFGSTLYVGRPDGISAYGYSTLPDSRQIDVSSLELVASVDDVEGACALSGARFVDSATSAIIAVDTFSLVIVRYELVDQGAGTAELSQVLQTFFFPGVQPAEVTFVDATKTSFSGQLAVVVGDEAEDGEHTVFDLRIPFDGSNTVDIAPLSWSFGRPSSVASIRYRRTVGTTTSTESFFLAPLPETPFLLSTPNNGFATDTGRAFEAGYSEVGFGLDESVVASDGDNVFGRRTSNTGPSLLLYNSGTGVIRRFSVSPLD